MKLSYRVVKYFNVCGEYLPTESDYSDYPFARAVFDAWKIGDKDLNGYELAKVYLLAIEDGVVSRVCNEK